MSIKKRNLLMLIPMMLISSCGLINNYTFENESYDVGGVDHFVYDSDMIVDGIGDEANYQGLETFDIYDPEFDVTLSTKSYFGENGFYFFTYVNDKSVFCNKSFDIPWNDGIEMHICVDPDRNLTTEQLLKNNKILDTMLQIRCDVSGRHQTWMGNYLTNSYEWTQYYKSVDVATHVDGKLNKVDASEGYSIEIFVPYATFNLKEKPSKISIMPAFNNTQSKDTENRKWYTYKGMAHNVPSSWMNIRQDGSLDFDGKDAICPVNLTCDIKDSRFLGQQYAALCEVDEYNDNSFERAVVKSYFDEDGIYFQFDVLDKQLTHFEDNIWNNDGIEIVIDVAHNGSDNIHKKGVFRIGVDVDNGVSTNICMNGFNDYVSKRFKVFSKTEIKEINIKDVDEECLFDYKYEYVYDIFVPFESLGIGDGGSAMVYFSFAVKSINESTYIFNRKNPLGLMEPDSWLWIDKHYPMNAKEFFEVTGDGIEL